MSKIDEFEQKIIKTGFTEEDLKEYEKLLTRVRDNFLKRQHCYSTAMQFPVEHTEDNWMMYSWNQFSTQSATS